MSDLSHSNSELFKYFSPEETASRLRSMARHLVHYGHELEHPYLSETMLFVELLIEHVQQDQGST